MKLKSYGKINLGLRVLGLRPDGYHEIETLLQTIDLCDEIELKPHRDAILVHCDHPLVPDGEANLAHVSARLLKETHNVEEGAEITIRKAVPVGGGLGGGSSNAAAVLKGLSDLWRVPLSEEDLFSIASHVGSDVPFFLKGGTALATGRGQSLKTLDLPWAKTSFVLIYPRLVVSTASAYKTAKINLTTTGKYCNLEGLFRKGTFDLKCLRALVTNDLENGVARRYRVIEAAKEALIAEGAAVAAMTGSGSTVYGLFSTRTGAREAAHMLSRPDWDVFLTKPINPGEEG